MVAFERIERSMIDADKEVHREKHVAFQVLWRFAEGESIRDEQQDEFENEVEDRGTADLIREEKHDLREQADLDDPPRQERCHETEASVLGDHARHGDCVQQDRNQCENLIRGIHFIERDLPHENEQRIVQVEERTQNIPEQ